MADDEARAWLELLGPHAAVDETIRRFVAVMFRVRRRVVWVASAEGFTDQPKVANGASDLLAEVFGEAGRHARASVGAPELPLGSPVELELIAEVEP